MTLHVLGGTENYTTLCNTLCALSDILSSS